jgi:geranylgeranyl pyrophosphate synthase
MKQKEYEQRQQERLQQEKARNDAMERAMKYHAEAHQILDSLEPSLALEVLRQLTDMQLIRIN